LLDETRATIITCMTLYMPHPLYLSSKVAASAGQQAAQRRVEPRVANLHYCAGVSRIYDSGYWPVSTPCGL